MIKIFESSEKIQKKESGSYCPISDDESSSVTLNETGDEINIVFTAIDIAVYCIGMLT